MTVSVQETSFPYTGNGVTTTFAFSCQVLREEDLSISIDGEEITSGFSISGIGEQTGGTVTFTSAPDDGAAILIERIVSLERSTDYQQNGDFKSPVVNQDFDRLWMAAQQHKSQLSRALKFPAGDSTNSILPAILARSSKLLGFDDSGRPVAVTPSEQSASALSLALAASSGASLVGYGNRTVEDKLQESVTPLDFMSEAQRNNVVLGLNTLDVTDAVQAAVSDGRPLDWLGYTYRITDTISHTFTTPMRWKSSGAKVLLDAAASVQNVFNLQANAASHRIDGEFNIDANLKAFIGFYFDNATAGTYPTNYADFHADGLCVRNVYRASTAFSGGDGIWIRGAWKNITLNKPVVENCRMAAGAGVSGSQGIFGITFSGNSAGDPYNMTINDPYVASVLSEDNTYYMDQDGIRVITSPDAVLPSEPSLRVKGGTIRNAYGRSIKVQCEYAVISGTKFVRTQGFDRGYGNEEIDFQEGGGTVENIECIYNGSAPELIVQFCTTRQAGKASVPVGSINGIKAVIHSSTTLDKVWRNAVFQDVPQVIRVSNVEVRGAGTLTNVCGFRGGTSTTSALTLLMSDIVAAPTGVFVECTTNSGATTGIARIKASRCINTGTSAINFKSTTSGNLRPYLSADDCIGFNEATRANNVTTPVGVVKRLGAFGPNDVSNGGLVRPVNFNLADGANYEIASTGATSNCGLLFVSASSSNTAQGAFGLSSSGAVALTPAATAFNVGTTADPGSGTYRIWKSTNGYTVQNNSGASRDFTCLLIG